MEIWREKLRGEGGWRAVANGMWQYPGNEVAVLASWLRCTVTFTINIYWIIYDFETTEVLSLSKPSANQHKCRHFSGTKTWEILDTNLLTAILLDNKNYELKKNLLKPPWNSSWSVTIVLAAADFRDHIFCPTLQMGQVNLKEGIIHECHSSEKMWRNGHHARVRSWSFW